MVLCTFHAVDVFSAVALKGNPVLVVAADAPLEAAQMQAYAAWNGMPETVYLRPGTDADTGGASGSRYHARIFSPRAELAFAGHPSLGAAHMAVESGLVPLPVFSPGHGLPAEGMEAATLWQHGVMGPVKLKLLRLPAGGTRIFVKTPAPGVVRPLALATARGVADAIGCSHAAAAWQVSAGANWLVVRLDDAAALAALVPDMPAIEALSHRLEASGITVYAPGGGAAARFEVRSFGPAIGVPEDAVCGGGNACVAALQHHLDGGPAPAGSYQTRQGRFVGRDGQVFVAGPVDDGRFWIGGATRTVMTGQVSL